MEGKQERRLPDDQNRDNALKTDALILSSLLVSLTPPSAGELESSASPGIRKSTFYKHRKRLIKAGFVVERPSSTYESTEAGRLHLLNMIKDHPWLLDHLPIKGIDFVESKDPGISGIVYTRARWIPQNVIVGYASAPSGPPGLFLVELPSSAD